MPASNPSSAAALKGRMTSASRTISGWRLGYGENLSGSRKTAWTTAAKLSHVVSCMDELDPIRELVVEAMAELEDALVDGLPAQSPRSGRREIENGLSALTKRIVRAHHKIELASRLVSHQE